MLSHSVTLSCCPCYQSLPVPIVQHFIPSVNIYININLYQFDKLQPMYGVVLMCDSRVSRRCVAWSGAPRVHLAHCNGTNLLQLYMTHISCSKQNNQQYEEPSAKRFKNIIKSVSQTSRTQCKLSAGYTRISPICRAIFRLSDAWSHGHAVLTSVEEQLCCTRLQN